MNTDNLRAILIFGPIQEKVIKFLDKIHVVHIEKVEGYSHALKGDGDRPFIFMCCVKGFGPFITFINWLFTTPVIADDISKENLKFLERMLDMKYESQEKQAL